LIVGGVAKPLTFPGEYRDSLLCQRCCDVILKEKIVEIRWEMKETRKFNRQAAEHNNDQLFISVLT